MTPHEFPINNKPHELPLYLYGRECLPSDKVWSEEAVKLYAAMEVNREVVNREVRRQAS